MHHVLCATLVQGLLAQREMAHLHGEGRAPSWVHPASRLKETLTGGEEGVQVGDTLVRRSSLLHGARTAVR